MTNPTVIAKGNVSLRHSITTTSLTSVESKLELKIRQSIRGTSVISITSVESKLETALCRAV